MATATTSASSLRFRQTARPGLLVFFIMGLLACSQTPSGPKTKVKVSVGEIKEISLASQGDSGTELIGTSDNQEVVEVSRRQLAPAVDTLTRKNTGPTVFQLKGVTVGTASVVFSTKTMNAIGNGQPVRTYVVQVTAK